MKASVLVLLAATLASSSCDGLGPDTGVPVDFFIDYIENAVDEELGMRVTEPVTSLSGS